MISQARRDEIRRTHIPSAGIPTQCAVRRETYPCDAIQLLDDIEQLEADARAARGEQQQKLLDLQTSYNDLVAKITRALRDLS